MKTELTPQQRQEITKDRKHDHFWIEDGILNESYRTIRGLRWRHIACVDITDYEVITDTELSAFGLTIIEND